MQFLKIYSTKPLVTIWSIAVVVVLVIAVDLFLVGIILFWYIKFKNI